MSSSHLRFELGTAPAVGAGYAKARERTRRQQRAAGDVVRGFG